jgi:pyruvate formate lyase activating enzyme
MLIGGFQKFSLLDYPGQLAAIVFTQGCNFRCPYCHNPGLVDPKNYTKIIPTSDVLAFLESRRGKLGAVSITGGEPTLQPDLLWFIAELREMGFKIKVDTNGSLPDVLEELASNKLVDYWAMDIKAPLHLYPVVSKSDVCVDNITRSMDILRDSGVEFEFRTTFFEVLFNWNDLAMIRELLKPGDRFFLQQCRYTDTLEDLRGSGQMRIELGETTYLHLMDHPSCRSLIQWGGEHNVKINIRSL